MIYTQNEFFSAIEKNKVESFAGIYMGIIILTELSHEDKYLFSHICVS